MKKKFVCCSIVLSLSCFNSILAEVDAMKHSIPKSDDPISENHSIPQQLQFLLPNPPLSVSNSLTGVDASLNDFVTSTLEPTFYSKTTFAPTYPALAGAAIAFNAQMSEKSLTPTDTFNLDNICHWYRRNWNEILPLFEPKKVKAQEFLSSKPLTEEYSPQRSPIKRELDLAFGAAPSRKKLLLLAEHCCFLTGLKLNREVIRRYAPLIKWFEDNWDTVKPYVVELAPTFNSHVPGQNPPSLDGKL